MWEDSRLQDLTFSEAIGFALLFMMGLLFAAGDVDLADPWGWIVLVLLGVNLATIYSNFRRRRLIPKAIGWTPDTFLLRYRDRLERIPMADVQSLGRGFVRWEGQAAKFTRADGREPLVEGIHWHQVDRMEAALHVFQRGEDARRRKEAAREGKTIAEAVAWEPLDRPHATRNAGLFFGALAMVPAAWGVLAVVRWGSFPVGSIILTLLLSGLGVGLTRSARNVPRAFAVTDHALGFEMPGGRVSIPIGEIASVRPSYFRSQGSLELERRDGRKEQFVNIPQGKLTEIVAKVEQARATVSSEARVSEAPTRIEGEQ